MGNMEEEEDNTAGVAFTRACGSLSAGAYERDIVHGIEHKSDVRMGQRDRKTEQ